MQILRDNYRYVSNFLINLFQVLSHELGHNFGMSHDFAEKHGGKTGCCNNKGVMSYGSRDFAGWSECSKSDFEHHYSSRNWGTECLEDISGEKFSQDFFQHLAFNTA